MICSIREAPRPPYSIGHEMPTQPALYIVRCHSTAPLERVAVGGHALVVRIVDAQVVGRFAASHCRISRRKASCSGV